MIQNSKNHTLGSLVIIEYDAMLNYEKSKTQNWHWEFHMVQIVFDRPVNGLLNLDIDKGRTP